MSHGGPSRQRGRAGREFCLETPSPLHPPRHAVSHADARRLQFVPLRGFLTTQMGPCFHLQTDDRQSLLLARELVLPRIVHPPPRCLVRAFASVLSAPCNGSPGVDGLVVHGWFPLARGRFTQLTHDPFHLQGPPRVELAPAREQKALSGTPRGFRERFSDDAVRSGHWAALGGKLTDLLANWSASVSRYVGSRGRKRGGPRGASVHVVHAPTRCCNRRAQTTGGVGLLRAPPSGADSRFHCICLFSLSRALPSHYHSPHHAAVAVSAAHDV